jgi:hypothetical protein
MGLETLLRATSSDTEEFFDDCRPDTAQSAGDEGMVAFYS